MADEYISRCLSAISALTRPLFGISDGPPLPPSFEASRSDPNWSDEIDRQYDSLLRRRTWRCVEQTESISRVPLKWTVRAKQLDESGNNFLYKASFVLFIDLQKPYGVWSC